MTYYKRDGRGFGGFGVDASPSAATAQQSSRSRILLGAFDNRGVESMPKIVVPVRAMMAAHAARLQKIRTMLPTARRSAGLRGFGVVPGLSADADAIVAAIQGLTELQSRVGAEVQTAVGAGSIVARAGSLAGDLGLPINHTDFIETCKREAERFTSLPGEGRWADVVSAYTGMRATASLREAGASFGQIGALATKFGDVYQGLSSGLGTSAEVVYNAVRDEMGFAGQGLRRLIDEVESSGVNNYINERTMGLAIGVAQRWAGVATGDEAAMARNILGAAGATATAIGSVMIGATTAMAAGSAVPVVGWVVAVAGAVLAAIAGLFSAFEKEPPPPPGPCSDTGAPRYADEWACARLFIASDPSLGIPDDNGVDDLRVDWAVKLDPNTGEALVQHGSPTYRRLLDVFPNGRRNLLSLEQDWIAGLSRTSLYEAEKLDCRGDTPAAAESSWASGCEYEWRPYITYGMAGTRLINDSTPRLYCVPNGDESMTRFLNADRTSAAIRYRVPPLLSDRTKENAGYRKAPWGEGSLAIGSDRIMKNVQVQYQRKAGILAAAILGGCAPFGLIQLRDTWAVCTGVGGRVHRDGATRGFWTPAIAAWKNNQVVVVPPQRFENPETSLATVKSWMREINAGTVGIPLSAVVDELEDEDARINKWHAPAASPPYVRPLGVLVARKRGIQPPMQLVRPDRIFESGLEDTKKVESAGMSTGKKLLVAGGAVIIVGGVIYAISRGQKHG